MPTRENFKELIENTTFEFVNSYDSHIILTSKINGNSIIIPLGGYIDIDLFYENKEINLWSKSKPGYYLNYQLDDNDLLIYSGDYWMGMNIRAIKI